MDELTLIHVRIEGILARSKDKGAPSDRDWEQIWKLVDRKIRLVEVETKRQLARENTRLNDVLEGIQKTPVGSKTNRRRMKS
jgi:hypothetical protein